ncbi:PTS sugar transporter subunit IIC [Endozoicomonas acroporae]|uniref:PTS sugar transporter subunit IIC n=1 Tax=Endozoicomonas acroporae TaxID=1701104 RepID=UPI000C789D77|nr:PTS transporter subunit EIIC [Endozoicomonas acroporae]
MSMVSDRISTFIEQYIGPVAGRVAAQQHISSIRDGFIAAIPFLIVGSCLLAFAFPPFDPQTQNWLAQAWLKFAAQYQEQILMPFNMTMGVMTLFITAGVAFSLANRYSMSAFSSTMLALMSFMLVSSPMHDGNLSAAFMGGTGIFTGILVAIYAVELQRFMQKKGLTIKLPEQVPPQIANSFDTLTPIVAVILTLYPLSIFVETQFGMQLPEVIMAMFKPLVSASDNYFSVVLAVLLVHLLWFAGIHGSSIVAGIMTPFWLANLTENQAALAHGITLPFTYTEPFHSFFIVIGGAGATMLLPFLLIRSRSIHLQSIGKVSAVPGLFNINEPVIFGMPIVMNPTFFIPFVFGPVINASIAYAAIKFGIIDAAVSLAPWTTPAPIGAAWAANWAIGSGLLALLLAVNALIIYYPFVKAYEKTLLAQEQQDEQPGIASGAAVAA